MADDDDLYDDDGNLIDQNDDGPKTPSDFAALRREKRERQKAADEALAAKRELAFMRAGIDPESSKIAGLFYKSYDGDLDVEKIQAAAIEIGFKQAAPATPEQQAAEQQRQANLAAQGAVASAAGSAEATPSFDAQNEKAMREALAAGGVDGLAAYLASQGVPQTEF